MEDSEPRRRTCLQASKRFKIRYIMGDKCCDCIRNINLPVLKVKRMTETKK